MSEEVGSVRPNPYIFDIENRRKRKPRLAHDFGAGAKCNKCGDKCPGFELHFWRKICQNCRCGKDDHEVEDEDEDIGQVVIGKLFERPPRTKKEELEYSYGNNLEIVNETTGKAEKMKFDWVPPNVPKNLAARYMALLPANKRPVAGSEAAKQRRKQLEQQLPLYDMDETHRCDNLPDEELQSFMAYLDRIKTQVAGQGMVQEILPPHTRLMAQPLPSHALHSHTSPSHAHLTGQPASPHSNIPPDQLPPPPPPLSNIPHLHLNDPLPPPPQHIDTSKESSHPTGEHGTGLYGQPTGKQGAGLYGHPAGEHGTGLYGQGNQIGMDNQGPLSSLPGQADNEMYARPYGQHRVSAGPKSAGSMQEFMGDMIQDYQNMNLAKGEPYGVTPGTSRPLTGLGTSALQQQQRGGPASTTPSYDSDPSNQHSATSTQPDYNIPPVPGSTIPTEYGTQGRTNLPTEYGTQGNENSPSKFGTSSGKHLSSEYDTPGKMTLPYEYGTPDRTSATTGYGTPGNKNLSSEFGTPGNKNLSTEFGSPGRTSAPTGYGTPGNKNLPSEFGTPGNMNLTHEYGTPGSTNLPSEFGTPGSQNHGPDSPSFLGKYGSSAGHGPVPYKPGFLPSQDGNMRPMSNVHPDQQAYTPGKESTLYGYQQGSSEPTRLPGAQMTGQLNNMGKPANLPGSPMTVQQSNMGNVQQPGIGASPQSSAKIPGLSPGLTAQVPYSAQMDTMKGAVMMAPGMDVNVLFPGESQMIGGTGGEGRSGTVPTSHHSKFSCQYCTQPMTVGDVAVFCERAGPEKCWHPACFCCFTCHELLADLIYFYQDGKVYCGRHFTQAAQMPRCTACDELIFGNSWTRADGLDWHLNHFCCFMCDSPLAGLRYVPDKEGCPYCLPCYMSFLAKLCEACEEKISPEETRCGHRGYFYHGNPQCFSCHTCMTSLIGKKFKMSKNWVFCSNECIQAAAEELHNNPNPKEKV